MVDCWLASLLGLVNVAELMGELIRIEYIVWCTEFPVSLSYFSSPSPFFFNRYILEGKELEFYMKKIQRKKGKGAGGA